MSSGNDQQRLELFQRLGLGRLGKGNLLMWENFLRALEYSRPKLFLLGKCMPQVVGSKPVGRCSAGKSHLVNSRGQASHRVLGA